jgi:hypothetical protein
VWARHGADAAVVGRAVIRNAGCCRSRLASALIVGPVPEAARPGGLRPSARRALRPAEQGPRACRKPAEGPVTWCRIGRQRSDFGYRVTGAFSWSRAPGPCSKRMPFTPLAASAETQRADSQLSAWSERNPCLQRPGANVRLRRGAVGVPARLGRPVPLPRWHWAPRSRVTTGEAGRRVVK